MDDSRAYNMPYAGMPCRSGSMLYALYDVCRMSEKRPQRVVLPLKPANPQRSRLIEF
jgi:hypothetical protein